MNWKCLMMVCALPFAAIAADQQPAAASDGPVGVYVLTDMQGKQSYEIMSRTEYKAVEALLKEEASAFPQAVTEAKKAWTSDKEKGQFYGWNKLKTRTIKIIGVEFAKRELAEKKQARLQDSAAKKIEQEEKMSKNKSERDTERDAKKQEQLESAAKLISQKLSDKLHRRVADTGFTSQDLAGEKEPVAEAAKDVEKKAKADK